jgi:hypothetical protein
MLSLPLRLLRLSSGEALQLVCDCPVRRFLTGLASPSNYLALEMAEVMSGVLLVLDNVLFR